MLRDGADDLLDNLAALENVKTGDAPDGILRGDPLVLIDVHLRDLDLSLVLLCDFLDDRGDDAARTAPFRPEIHQHRNLRIEHFGFERAVAHLDYRIGHGRKLLTR